MLTNSLKNLDSLANANKTSHNNLAQEYAGKAFMLAEKSNSPEAMARACLMMGIAYRNVCNDSSYTWLAKSLKIANQYSLEEVQPGIYYQLAMIYWAASDAKTAVVFIDSSIIIAQKLKDYVMLSNALNALGDLKFDLNDMMDAKAMFDSAYSTAVIHDLPKQMGVAMASQSRFQNDLVVSETMRKKAIDLLRKQPGNEEEIGLILINLGVRSQNPDTAIKYYKAAIEIAKAGCTPNVEIAAYNNLAYSLIDKHETDQAGMNLINYAIPLAIKVKNTDWLASLYDTYTDVLVAQGKTAKALEYA